MVGLLVAVVAVVAATPPQQHATLALRDPAATARRPHPSQVASRDPAAASNMPTLSVAEQEAQVLSLPAPIAQGHLHFVSTDAAMAQQSSSAVRKALASGEGLGASARAALPECLHEFVQSQGLYAD